MKKKISDLIYFPREGIYHKRILKLMMKTMQEYGQTVPVIIDKQGRVVRGNITVEAAQKLGWIKIDVERYKPKLTNKKLDKNHEP